MTDKDVGRLWREYHCRDATRYPQSDVRDLIRKLVEERQDKYELQGFLTQGKRMAIESFGIDPATYE